MSRGLSRSATYLIHVYRGGKTVKIDGQTLSIAAVTAAARYHARAELDDSSVIRERVNSSRNVISEKVESGTSVYGLSTGFGGSGMPPPLLDRRYI